MAALAFHLMHGFQSAFQSLGWNHPKYTPLIQALGTGISLLIPALFALIPVVMLLTNS
jgi:succinate dehydrogenase / fumarate reductase cytochrome b subunit